MGTRPNNSACFPAIANVCPMPRPRTPTVASTSVMGTDGSVKTPPRDRVALTTTKVVPTGDGE
jgi:hypothetical protein